VHTFLKIKGYILQINSSFAPHTSYTFRVVSQKFRFSQAASMDIARA
jgi:hypothetical protein